MCVDCDISVEQHGPYRQRVQRGIDHLNSYFGGTGWADRINTDTLNLTSEHDCVLGQLHRSYRAALRLRRWENVDAIKHGFVLSNGELRVRDGTRYWADRIRALQISNRLQTPEVPAGPFTRKRQQAAAAKTNPEPAPEPAREKELVNA